MRWRASIRYGRLRLMRTRRRTREAGLDASHPPRSDPWDAPTRADRLRQVANVLNLSTPCGLFVALVGGADLASGPRGTVIATGYRWRVPAASAFTVGDVIVSRLTPDRLTGRPRLLAHETRHATQYACCLGLPMLPAYGLAAGWSWLRTGDPASRNLFERRAGLVDGGYAERPLRRRGGPPR
jgi:hypothetical protein